MRKSAKNNNHRCWRFREHLPAET